MGKTDYSLTQKLLGLGGDFLNIQLVWHVLSLFSNCVGFGLAVSVLCRLAEPWFHCSVSNYITFLCPSSVTCSSVWKPICGLIGGDAVGQGTESQD